jgi:hypothetical protein
VHIPGRVTDTGINTSEIQYRKTTSGNNVEGVNTPFAYCKELSINSLLTA